MKAMRAFSVFLLVACSAARVSAQEGYKELPDSIALEAVRSYNEATIRLRGDSEISQGMPLTGSVALLDGELTVAGTIDGDVIVVNGDLTLVRGARVTGSALVVGGRVTGDTLAVAGGVRAYAAPLRYRFDGAGITVAPPALQAQLSAGRDFRFGRTDVLLAIRGDYNRVEGLPLTIGPRARLGHSNPTVLEAFAIVRTERPFSPEHHGWAARVEQYIGGRGALSAGVRGYSEIVPIESWMIGDTENSFAAFLFHRDFRDHYERTGYTVYLRGHHPTAPLEAELSLRDEDHLSVRASSVFSVFDNGDAWRDEPVVGEGDLQSLALRMTYDTRNDVRDPAAGWLVRAELEQGLGGQLGMPVVLANDPEGNPLELPIARERFTHAIVDARRYARLNPQARVTLRIVAAGSVDGRSLPPQRQHALGGEGSLPGFPLFQFDCGARDANVLLRRDDPYPYYGCDRLALIQLEYDASFPYARRVGERLDLGFDLARTIRWALFFDAGRAWNETEARNGRGGGQSAFAADAGFGVRIGPLGLYGGLPLSGRGGHGINFFVRLGHRL